MFVIEIIPLTTLPPNVPQLLSYFFDKKLRRGALVEVKVGHRLIKAVVIDAVPLSEYKLGIKKAEFELKKIVGVVSEEPQISDRQIYLALWLSKTYYAPLGMCLKHVLPPFFLKQKFPYLPETNIATKEHIKRKPDFILTNAKNTLQNILPIIKSEVSQDAQAIILVPDTQTIDYFYQYLSKDFSVEILSSSISTQKFYETWKNVQSGKTQILVGTRQSLLLPFKNLRLVLVDDPLHEFYKSDMSPRYNAVELAQYISKEYNCRLVFTSPVTGVENRLHIKTNDYELMDKSLNKPPVKVVSMVNEIKSDNFFILSRELKNKILSIVNPSGQNKKVLIFSPRRGHSGILVCQNCGWTAKCQNCATAYRIHRSENLVLMCHHCGDTQKLSDHCPNCNSSKLKSTGPSGSQKIYEEIMRLLSHNEISDVPVLILDTDVTVNQTEENEVISEITLPKTSILIATQMIFSYRYDLEFDLVAIMNADSLVQSPDFRTEERLFYQLEKLADFLPDNNQKSTRDITIQTFNPENPAFSTEFQDNYSDFYDRELEIRKSLSYPPFSRLIKLTYRHPNKEVASREARTVVGKLKMAVMQLGFSDKIHITDSAPGYTEKERGLYVYNVILKSKTEKTPREILKYVPPRWLIDVNPRTLL